MPQLSRRYQHRMCRMVQARMRCRRWARVPPMPVHPLVWHQLRRSASGISAVTLVAEVLVLQEISEVN